MFEKDAFDALLDQRVKLMLIVTFYPGQATSKPMPAPEHLRKHFANGGAMPPHLREATQDELIAYVEQKLTS